jgi:uncharacterized protein
MLLTAAQILAALEPHVRFPSVLHGPPHWARVRRFGTLLAARVALPPEAHACVELFAWLHDLAREDDAASRRHAVDGAAQIDAILPVIADPLTPDQVETLRAAIHHHSDGMVAARAWEVGAFDRIGWPRDLVVATVGCCWDADRLDLPRVGVAPAEQFMSTPVWRDVQPLAARIHAGGVTSAGTVSTTYDPSGVARQQAYEQHVGSGAKAVDVWPRG